MQTDERRADEKGHQEHATCPGIVTAIHLAYANWNGLEQLQSQQNLVTGAWAHNDQAPGFGQSIFCESNGLEGGNDCALQRVTEHWGPQTITNCSSLHHLAGISAPLLKNRQLSHWEHEWIL